MNYDRPALLESLASEYVLGTLRGPARRRFERVLASLHNARMAVATWEARLHPLAQSVPESAPSVQVWKRIESHINGARAQRTAARAWRLNWLRPLGGVLSGIIMGVLIVKMAPSAFFPIEAQQEKALSQSYVGLLLDQTGIPSVLASTTRHGKRLKLKILKPITVPAGQALTLWALPHDQAGNDLPPMRLGSIPSEGKGELILADTAEKLLANVSRLGVSLEASGSQPEGPSTFVLSGHCVRLW